MTNGKIALVLGATGGVGGETARALIAHGWQVRGLTRTPRSDDGRPGDGIDWIVGDALDGEAVLRAAQGASAIVHAVNPPGYRDWEKLVMPMLDNSIAAAESVGARLALPGTIYNYDPRSVHVAAENAPQRPNTKKGAWRVEMERAIEAACDRGMRALILRAGDFFGPRPGNSWLSQGMITPGKPVKRIMYPGAAGVGHAWAYLPDVAETFARLLDRDAALPAFARYHFQGIWDADGSVMADAIRTATGNLGIRVGGFPWVLLPLIAPFNATMREMIEMRPFWQNPFALDNRALVEILGEEPHTPLVWAMATTLDALGCGGTVEKGGEIAYVRGHA
ncbi:MAG: NAD(P)H-binding protein [Candidatus Sphingomonas phytovorans]|nr:NAD-dependent epimerase/dehydratase family protein [Sphingomonas sp.]WEJ98893.1 MAG: NAD(P)H-binding protein [Sphingomonas sp.]